MSLSPPPYSPPALTRKSAVLDITQNPNENNDYVYSNWSSNSNSSERNSLSNRKTIKKRPLAKAKLKSSRRNSSSNTKTTKKTPLAKSKLKPSSKKKSSNRTTRRRPLAKPFRKRGGSARVRH